MACQFLHNTCTSAEFWVTLLPWMNKATPTSILNMYLLHISQSMRRETDEGTSRQLTLGGVWLELGEINNFLNEMSNITSILSRGVDFHWDNRSLVEEYKRQSWKNFEFTCMYIFFNIYYSDLKLEHSFVYSTYKSLYQIITSGAPFSSLCLTGVQHLKLQWRTSKTDIPHCRMGGGVLRELCWFHVQYGMSII